MLVVGDMGGRLPVLRAYTACGRRRSSRLWKNPCRGLTHSRGRRCHPGQLVAAGAGLGRCALVFLSVVVARAIGGVVAAFGVPSISAPIGIVGGGFSLPTYFRLQVGTGWADIDSGLLLLGCVGLPALPRMVWDVAPKDQGSQVSLVVLVANGVVAAAAVVAGVIAIVNLLWNEPGGVNYNEAVNVAEYVGASALAALAATLCWFARPIVAMESES